MAGETKRFTFNFDLTKSGNTFTVSGSPIGGAYDIIDNVSDGSGDSTSQLGDVTNDRFTARSVSTNGTLTRTYIGKTADGFVSKAGSLYYLYSNTYYASGSQINNFSAANTSDPSTIQGVCFTTGTLIRTVSGDVAVEALKVGELAVTSSGTHRPIRWIGYRTLSCKGRTDLLPVRIVAHAFGDGRPARDLVVSPAHAIAIDMLGEVLIPACRLINGTTITQIDVETVTYWHVELDSHDILLAEGLPAESYLDCGNRRFFANADATDLQAMPDARSEGPLPFCRPFHEDGPLVDLVRSRLHDRAESLGWRKVEEAFAGLHAVADGHVIHPDVDGLTARFVIHADAQNVRLVSAISVPAHVLSGSSDDRQLGVSLVSLVVDDGLTGARRVALDDPRLSQGFYPVDEAGDAQWRWTNGEAVLPASVWDGCRGTLFLRVQLSSPALPRWISPSETASVVDSDKIRRES